MEVSVFVDLPEAEFRGGYALQNMIIQALAQYG
jgi:hypothetical protein